MEKPKLRTQFCTLRECIPPGDAARASTALCHRLAAWLSTQAIRYPTIMTYLAFRNEIDLSPLFDLLPQAHWVVPRVIEERKMALHPYDAERLVRHRFGMLEPDPELPTVDPAVLDVVLVPGVAFDRRGGRLGFGGGYYDRFLVTTPAARVGISYDQCLADELPCSEHDQRMDWIATQSDIIHCAPFWRKE